MPSLQVSNLWCVVRHFLTHEISINKQWLFNHILWEGFYGSGVKSLV